MSAEIAERFVREALPWEREAFGRGFPKKLDRIAPGLAAAYSDAARTMVGNGFETNADTIATGAVRDLAAFELVVEAALDDLASVRGYFAQEGAEEWRAIEDGERDHAVEEGHQSNHEGDGYTSGVFVDAYVGQLRSEGRWQSIAAHPRVEELLDAWARDVALSADPPGDGELEELMRLSHGKPAEHQTWWAVREHWQADLASELQARLVVGTTEIQLRSELVACGVLRAPDTVIEALDSLGGKPAAQLQLVVDVWEARGRLWTKGRSAKLKRIADALTPELQEIVAALGFRRRAAKGVNASALDRILAAAGSLPARTLKLLVPIIVASGGDPTGALRRWLLIADDKDDALKATEAAIATGSIPLIELGLRHKRADARRAALVALARAKADPLSDELLRLAHDPGSRVRRALVAMLKDRPHPLHLPVLLELIHDTWSDTDAYYNEPESYPIAREAIEAVARRSG